MKEVVTKECTICGENKPLCEYYSIEKESKKKGKYIYYHPYCKKCASKKAYQNELNNEESRKRQNSDRVKARRAKTKRKWHQENKEHEREYQRKWRQNNREKLKEYNLNKLANKTHDISNTEWNSCKEYFDNSCAYCGMSEEAAKEKYGQQLHKEHVNHEGSNKLENCVPACKGCNSSKHTFSIKEWYNEENERYSQERKDKVNKWINKEYSKFTTK